MAWRPDEPRRRIGRGAASAGQTALVAGVVADLLTLAKNEEARRLLGVDGVLDGELGVSFLEDPLDWVAADIALALGADDADDDPDMEPAMLTTLVAEIRLCEVLKGPVDEPALVREVERHLLEAG